MKLYIIEYFESEILDHNNGVLIIVAKSKKNLENILWEKVKEGLSPIFVTCTINQMVDSAQSYKLSSKKRLHRRV